MDPNDGRVISNFIMQALMDIILQYRDWKPNQSFCYVDDLIEL
jgi:UDP-glucuronate decarboxylase